MRKVSVGLFLLILATLYALAAHMWHFSDMLAYLLAGIGMARLNDYSWYEEVKRK